MPEAIADLLRSGSDAERVQALKAHLDPLVRDPCEECRWVAELVRLAADGELPRVVARLVISDLAWLERSLGIPIRRVPDVSGDTGVRYVGYYVTQRLRFDFRFQQILERADEWASVSDDGQLLAMAAFAELGLRTPRALDAYERAVSQTDRDKVTRDILLHGLWFGTHLADQPSRIIDISDEMLARGEPSPNVYYRRAFAFRRLGDLDRAMSSILIAMDLLPAGEREVHQDYARERELIDTTRFLKDQIERETNDRLDDALRQLDERAAAAEQTVSRSLISLVEVLGLFIALIGFLGAGAVSVLQDQSVAQRVMTLVGLLVGSVGFFLTLRFVVTSPVRTRRRREPAASADRPGRGRSRR